MTARVWPIDAVAGGPSYNGRALRQAQSAYLSGASATRPLGVHSGVRPGTPTTTVEVTSTTWTVHPHAGAIDAQAAAEASGYLYAFDADVTGAMTAADGTNARKDILYVRVDDPAEGDGTSVPAVAVGYLAGSPSGTPAAPALPARSMLLGEVLVPKAGGGSPSVTWKAPAAVAAGAPVPVASQAERDALAEYAGLQVVRLDDAAAVETWDGTVWRSNRAGDWVDLTVTGAGWFEATGSGLSLQARLLPNDQVEIVGAVTSTASATPGEILQLPVGMRPSVLRYLPAHRTSGGSGGVPFQPYVDASGYLRIDTVYTQSFPAGLNFPVSGVIPL